MKQILPNLYRLEGLRIASVYLIVQGEGLALVDTGAPVDRTALLRDLATGPFDVGRLRTIILTHAHVDHTGNAAALVRASGRRARVLAHADDVPFIQGERDLPPSDVYHGGLLGRLIERARRRLPAEPVRVDEPLRDGQVLDLLGGLRVVHAPGHTPGSVLLHQPEAGLVFCGDVVVSLGVPGGRLMVPPAGFDWDTLVAHGQVARLAALEPRLVLPGHGGPIADGVADRLRALARSLVPAGVS